MNSYPGEYEMITPTVSILAQPSVAVVDDNVKVNKSEELYSDEAQRLAAKYGYRPSDKDILSEYGNEFDLNVRLTIIDDYGGWDEAYRIYFDDGGWFDEIYDN